MRVVNLVGFRRGYGFLGELLALAKPFGDVVKHLVLDLRPEVKPCSTLTVALNTHPISKSSHL